jgi:hypothetical protein
MMNVGTGNRAYGSEISNLVAKASEMSGVREIERGRRTGDPVFSCVYRTQTMIAIRLKAKHLLQANTESL